MRSYFGIQKISKNNKFVKLAPTKGVRHASKTKWLGKIFN